MRKLTDRQMAEMALAQSTIALEVLSKIIPAMPAGTMETVLRTLSDFDRSARATQNEAKADKALSELMAAYALAARALHGRIHGTPPEDVV